MLGPDFQAPEARMPQQWSGEGADLFKKPSKEESLGWWKKFNDPIPNFRATLATYKNSLAVLFGIPPEDVTTILRSGSGIPEYSTQIGLGAPAELLRRRPDVRRAEMQAAAQSAQIGIARTEL